MKIINLIIINNKEKKINLFYKKKKKKKIKNIKYNKGDNHNYNE